MTESTLITHHDEGSDAAVVFVHGFGGDPKKTWGQFPALLSRRRNLQRWDVFSLGYPTSLGCDIVGLWKANPDIPAVAGDLKTRLQSDRTLSRYGAITLIAHSMGGLAVQRALVDHPGLASRVYSVILFGTPSGGLKKAAFFKFWKRQLRNMAIGSAFIADLRRRWQETFGTKRPFQFLAVAGDQDEFVTRDSSLGPFALEDCDHIPGDHLSIVKPQSPNLLAVDLVEQKLTGGEVGKESARRAAERIKARARAESRLAICDQLDEEGLRDLGLDLDRIGEMEKAIEVLKRATPDQYDARGVLAGRLKRRWLLARRAADGKEALSIYEDAYRRAAENRQSAAAFYNGINTAFMKLAFSGELADAQAVASDVLLHCRAAARDRRTPRQWLRATEGEAHLVLGKPELAIAKYSDAVAATAAAWEKDSMYQQATRIASILNDKETAAALEGVFDRG